MMCRFKALAATAGLAMLAACAGTGSAPVEVTRFHLGQPVAPSDISIEPFPGADGQSLEFRSYAAAVAPELSRLGFRVAPGLRQAELVAVVGVERGSREDLSRPRSGLSIGLGGGTWGSGIGVGGGVSVPVGKQRARYVVGTRLSVQLKRRSDGTVFWEGRAQTEARADAPDASPEAAVAKLAHALFQGFPGESGRTITVK